MVITKQGMKFFLPEIRILNCVITLGDSKRIDRYITPTRSFKKFFVLWYSEGGNVISSSAKFELGT